MLGFAYMGRRGGDERLLPTLLGDQSSCYRGIVAALRGHTANPVSPGEALAVIAVVEAALRSARKGTAFKFAHCLRCDDSTGKTMRYQTEHCEQSMKLPLQLGLKR